MDPDQRAKKILALLHERVRLAPLHRWIFYLTFGAVWLSGGLWLGAEWFKDPDLGPVRTPLQAVAMKVPGAAMLVYLAMLGTLWLHIRRGFALQVNRWSGSVVIAVNAILPLTAWLLYYAVGDTGRKWSSLVHWSIGMAVLPLICAHIYLGRRNSKAKPSTDSNLRPAGARV